MQHLPGRESTVWRLASTSTMLLLDRCRGCFDEVSRSRFACIWPEFTSIWPVRATWFQLRRGGRGAVIPRRVRALPLLGCPFTPSGGGALLGQTGNFVHQLIDSGSSVCKKILAARYLIDSVEISICVFIDFHQRQVDSLGCKISTMKNEKLKSTTVRFTDSDLHLIDSLQEKLGLGMIHIIRLAIRRLAETENLLKSTSTVGKH